jgi:DNA-binding response OmpR family regulator
MPSAMRVLIVEDDSSVRHFLDIYLTRKGFETLTAPMPAVADALLLDFPGPLELAILDVLLPGGMTGVAYSDDLRRRWPDMRAIFITGWEHGFDVAQVEKRGDVLYKPFVPDDLFTLIQRPRR